MLCPCKVQQTYDPIVWCYVNISVNYSFLILLICGFICLSFLGWYDVKVLPVHEFKWSFKEGDVAILSAPRPGSGLLSNI